MTWCGPSLGWIRWGGIKSGIFQSWVAPPWRSRSAPPPWTASWMTARWKHYWNLESLQWWRAWNIEPLSSRPNLSYSVLLHTICVRFWRWWIWWTATYQRIQRTLPRRGKCLAQSPPSPTRTPSPWRWRPSSSCSSAISLITRCVTGWWRACAVALQFLPRAKPTSRRTTPPSTMSWHNLRNRSCSKGRKKFLVGINVSAPNMDCSSKVMETSWMVLGRGLFTLSQGCDRSHTF